MKYVEVAVDSPWATRGTFSYEIPEGMSLCPGQAVWVPFGDRVLQGIVFELKPTPAVEQTKEVISPIDSKPLLSHVQLQLARWLSAHYVASLFAAAAPMLPPGSRGGLKTFFSKAAGAGEEVVSGLSSLQREVLSVIEKKGKVELGELKKVFGAKVEGVGEKLAGRGIVLKAWEWKKPKIGPKHILYVRLAVSKERAEQEAIALRPKRAKKQSEVLKLLADTSSPLTSPELKRRVGCNRETLSALEKKGLVRMESVRVVRDPLRGRSFEAVSPPALTPAQGRVWAEIEKALTSSCEGSGGKPAVFLLHGVTGSGKTEIYLRALARTIEIGKRGIVLVPELALTPQTVERFGARFPGRVAVLHSGLSPGERFDEWWRIKEGVFDVVIGSRSAIFAPQPDLKLIILDEEHEWTYKQQDVSPRYHARDVAIHLAELTGAVVILGSATPDLGSHHLARTGRYRLLELPERAPGDTRLPQVEVVDMRRELREGNRSVFSRALISALTSVLDAGEQSILFLNRRGTATFVQCRDCGYALRCKRCDISYTYHSTTGRLACHYCNRGEPLPSSCPQCGGRRIRYLGAGTQRIEEEVKALFPRASLLRWDRDVTRDWRSHQAIMGKFLSHEADILIGTQMIAKGLHFPLVTLVGIVNADIGLNLPDFRSGEQVFQVLSQVAGRAGRGEKAGRVIVQTYSPHHYAIAAAARHDYATFYEREGLFRQENGYPPFSRLVRMIFSHPSAAECQREGLKLRRALEERLSTRGIPNVDILGPAPAYMQRMRGRFRWHIILRTPTPELVLEDLRIPQGWTLDIDPISLL